jgi:hypothetical protein
MKKLSVVDAAEYFGISKEAIHNRIRRGSLETVIEDEQKMIIINSDAKPKTTRSSTRVSSKTPNNRYYKLLEEQNATLQTRVTILEDETRTLRDQKELMLIDERKKIEQIYRDKDEQLKNVLNTLSKQFMLNAPLEAQEETVEVEMVEETEEKSRPLSLKKYLKTTKFSEKKVAKIKAKFKKRAKKDERIITIGSKIYLDPSKYDYSDLI